MLKLFLCFILISWTQAAIESLDDLEFDGNDRLTNHYLLYHGWCPGVNTLRADLRETIEIDGELKHSFFGETVPSSSCHAVCLERGWHRDHVLHPVPLFKYPGKGLLQEFVTNNCQKVEWGLISYLSNTATVNWLNGEGERVPVGSVEPGERHTFWITSYLGHEFDVIEDGNPENIFHFEVTHNSIHHIGEYVSGIRPRDVHDLVHQTFEGEWVRMHEVKRTFTQFGFNKGKVPLHLFGSMSAYYYNNRKASTIEEWDNKGVFVNWWEKDVMFVSMPFALKKYWQSELKQMVESWVGVPLELTDIYGMRRYEDGARLLTHVDRINTHAASLIINVDQAEIREPWTVEIYDFANRLHEIEMSPGDIVYYESARCLHGRQQPLRGKYYVNLFAHYRPIDPATGKGDPYWYSKPNPDWTPKPVFDELGHCRSNGTKSFCSGQVSAPYLSPKLETLHGAEDLYNYWVRTGEEGYSNKEVQRHPIPHGVESEL